MAQARVARLVALASPVAVNRKTVAGVIDAFLVHLDALTLDAHIFRPAIIMVLAVNYGYTRTSLAKLTPVTVRIRQATGDTADHTACTAADKRIRRKLMRAGRAASLGLGQTASAGLQTLIKRGFLFAQVLATNLASRAISFLGNT